MASERANRIRALMAEMSSDESAELPPPTGGADAVLQRMGGGSARGLQTPGLGNELFNAGATELLASRVGLGGFKPALDAGLKTAGAMPGPPLVKGAAGLLAGGATGLGILGARAGIGAGVEALAGLGDEQPRGASNAGVKQASEKIKLDMERGGYSQAIGDMIGLGLAASGKGLRRGANVFADLLRGHEAAGFGSLGVVRSIAQKVGARPEVDATKQAGAALRAVLDSMEKTSDLSTVQRLMLRDGRFQELGDSLVKDLSDAVGPHMDVGDYGKMVVDLQKSKHDLAMKAFDRVYDNVLDEAAMGKKIPGVTSKRWTEPVNVELRATPARGSAPMRDDRQGFAMRRVQDPDTGVWRDEYPSFESITNRATGGGFRGDPEDLEVIRAYPALSEEYYPGTGIAGAIAAAKGAATGRSIARAGESGMVDEAARYLTLFQDLPDVVPFGQIDGMRREVGSIVGKLSEAKARGQFVPSDVLGRVKNVYSKLSEAEELALRGAGMTEKADQFRSVTDAYREEMKTFNSKLIRQTRQFVEGGEPGKVYSMIESKSPSELRDFFATTDGKTAANSFRGTWLGEGLFTRAVATDASTGMASLSANKMNDFIYENEEKIRALYPDNPGVVDKAKRLSSMIGIANSGKNRDMLKQYGINISENGILFTRLSTAPGGVRRVEFDMSPELLTKLMESPRATESLLQVIGYPLGKVGRGGLIRGGVGQYQEAQYNAALMDLERETLMIEGVQAIVDRNQKRKSEMQKLSTPPTLGPSL